MKSSCCGAEVKKISSHVFDDMNICAECKDACHSIPDDIMSRKEIIKICDNRLKAMLLMGTVFSLELLEIEQLLKSVKHHMGGE